MRIATCVDCGAQFEVVKIKGRVPKRCDACFRRRAAQRMAEWRLANPERARATYARNNAKRLADPEHLKDKREREIRRRYGIEPGEFERLMRVQDGRCAICHQLPSRRVNGRTRPGLAPALHVDHDHGTGRVRGLLCGNCNTMLGLAGEDPQVLAQAISYLRKE